MELVMELLAEELPIDLDSVVDAATLVKEISRFANDSFVSGFEAGKAEGYEEGFANGFVAGKEEGYDEGYTNGRASAMRIDRSGDGGACGWHWRWRW